MGKKQFAMTCAAAVRDQIQVCCALTQGTTSVRLLGLMVAHAVAAVDDARGGARWQECGWTLLQVSGVPYRVGEERLHVLGSGGAGGFTASRNWIYSSRSVGRLHHRLFDFVIAGVGCNSASCLTLSLLFSFASLLQPMLNFVFNSDLPKVFIVQSKDSRPLKVTMSSQNPCNAFSGLLLV